MRSRFLPALLVLPVCVVLACHESVPTEGPGSNAQNSAAVHREAGDSQFAIVGHPVPVNPMVRVTDDSGNTLKNVFVRFAVTSGGGSATGTDVLTDSAGLAAVGSWVLGPDTGINTMTAVIPSQPDVPGFVFTARALCDCWKVMAPLNVQRTEAGSVTINGKLYVLGGYNWRDYFLPVEVYDPETNAWTARASMPQIERSGIAAIDDRIYVVSASWLNTGTPGLKVYDPAADQWTTLTPPSSARGQLGAAALGGILYALGGLRPDTGFSNTVEAYDPNTDTWTLKSPMPTARHAMAIATLNGLIYVIGGQGRGEGGESTQSLASVEAYDPASDTWSTRASLPARLVSATANVVDGIIYVAGGGPLYWQGRPYVYAYDPVGDAWSIQPPMPTTRIDATASVLNGVLYVIAGTNYSDTSGALPTVEAYKP